MRLVFVTQRVDAADPALGATVPKLRALAERVDELVVLALDAVPTDLPPNVRVKTFGAGAKAARGARYAAALAPELRRRPVAVVAHMAPIYAVLAAPLARPLGVPVLLWFTHWRASPLLRLAEGVSTVVLSVARESFPLPTRKLVAVGHGIEIPPLGPPHEAGGLRALALGRTSPAKGLPAIVEAVASVGGDVSLEIRGPSLTEEERVHRDELAALVDRLGAGDRVTIEQPLARTEIEHVYGRSDVLVNNMRAGALDKVVYEAAAAALPVLVASAGFDELVDGVQPPLRFAQDDVHAIATGLRALADAGADERRRIGLELRGRVAARHSVDHWADAVVAAAR